MIIREAQADDSGALLSMVKELAASFVVDPAIFKNSLGMCLSDESSLILLAEVDSAPVGYLLGFHHLAFGINGRVANVQEIYVAANHRNSGVGRSLMRAFEKWAESRGSVQVTVCTHRAPGFYSALGYEQTGIRFTNRLKTQAEQSLAGDVLEDAPEQRR